MSIGEGLGAVGVVGVVLAVYFYFRPRRFTKLRYATRSVNLVRDLESQLEGLSVKYDGADVKTLTVTKLAFWNAGNEMIDGDQNATKEPLHVVVDREVALWDMDVVASIPDASNVTMSGVHGKDGDVGGRVLFDFLNPHHGGIVQVIHTGTSGRQVELRGTLKGAGSPERVGAVREKLWLVLFGVAQIAILGTSLLFADDLDGPADWQFVVALFGGGAAVLFVAALFARRFYRRFPEGFEEFEKLPGSKTSTAE